MIPDGHAGIEISIHALREEGDARRPSYDHLPGAISIHALREEGDPVNLVTADFKAMDFYPRPPRGGRRENADPGGLDRHFYPRPPRGGRRVASGRRPLFIDFYPRPPRGGRHNARNVNTDGTLFLSTPSARRATSAISVPPYTSTVFLSTPSARRATVLVVPAAR